MVEVLFGHRALQKLELGLCVHSQLTQTI